VTVTADHVAALRAALAGDAGAFDRLDREHGLGDGEEFPVLLATAFIAAVRRRFPGGWPTADVIGFVGQVRVRGGGYGDGGYGDLSPGLAEQLILSVLRDAALRGQFGEAATAYAQFVLLKELVSGYGDGQLNALLAEARDGTDRWIAGRPGP
jgi:hypothetical protein